MLNLPNALRMSLIPLKMNSSVPIVPSVSNISKSPLRHSKGSNLASNATLFKKTQDSPYSQTHLATLKVPQKPSDCSSDPYDDIGEEAASVVGVANSILSAIQKASTFVVTTETTLITQEDFKIASHEKILKSLKIPHTRVIRIGRAPSHHTKIHS